MSHNKYATFCGRKLKLYKMDIKTLHAYTYLKIKEASKSHTQLLREHQVKPEEYKNKKWNYYIYNKHTTE